MDVQKDLWGGLDGIWSKDSNTSINQGSLCRTWTHPRFGSEWVMVYVGLTLITQIKDILFYFLIIKVLLDGSGVLKFGNFCLAKTAGGTQEDLLTFFTSSEEIVEDHPQVSIDSIKTKLQGRFDIIFAVISSWGMWVEMKLKSRFKDT